MIKWNNEVLIECLFPPVWKEHKITANQVIFLLSAIFQFYTSIIIAEKPQTHETIAQTF